MKVGQAYGGRFGPGKVHVVRQRAHWTEHNSLCETANLMEEREGTRNEVDCKKCLKKLEKVPVKISFHKLIADGHYDVKVDGVCIGQVEKRVERYNLRRAVTVVHWYAWRWDGDKRVKVESSTMHSYRTRGEAAQALIAAVK